MRRNFATTIEEHDDKIVEDVDASRTEHRTMAHECTSVVVHI
jgi:hypothetical protein